LEIREIFVLLSMTYW